MGKVTFLLISAMMIACVLAIECPISSKVTTCSPKCTEDKQCDSIGRKCCPNICNTKSCVQPNQLSSSDSSGYKGSSSSGSGTYCGNVKCGPHEKCQNDRSTSRPKCVRA